MNCNRKAKKIHIYSLFVVMLTPTSVYTMGASGEMYQLKREELSQIEIL